MLFKQKILFNRCLLKQRRQRFEESFPEVSYLHTFAAQILGERLSFIKRRFSHIVDLSHSPSLANVLTQSSLFSEEYLFISSQKIYSLNALPISFDEELPPLAHNSCDLILSNLSLHWINDIPGTLIQIKHALKPDGLFMGAFLGGETLFELKSCFADAEIALKNGISSRFSPLVTLKDAGTLLQRAGFALPVVDHIKLTVTYSSIFQLFSELQKMGEANCLFDRPKTFTGKKLFEKVADLYEERFATSDGRLPATFDIIFLSGWAPHPSQQQALKPGSAHLKLAHFLED
jgi:SAM-dependent methyltransferase